ncbi:MAG TPA: STAS/SEC14 domain-containing protein [Puia sp.]|nr:STAS/SEC14 domain-containing protein [Puia sp.]
MTDPVAIVSDVEKIQHFTDKAGHLAPGEYKGFRMSKLNDAILWAAEPEKVTSH